jgi:hypothetical protein
MGRTAIVPGSCGGLPRIVLLHGIAVWLLLMPVWLRPLLRPRPRQLALDDVAEQLHHAGVAAHAHLAALVGPDPVA